MLRDHAGGTGDFDLYHDVESEDEEEARTKDVREDLNAFGLEDEEEAAAIDGVEPFRNLKSAITI